MLHMAFLGLHWASSTGGSEYSLEFDESDVSDSNTHSLTLTGPTSTSKALIHVAVNVHFQDRCGV
jgi:hypothetical protein